LGKQRDLQGEERLGRNFTFSKTKCLGKEKKVLKTAAKLLPCKIDEGTEHTGKRGQPSREGEASWQHFIMLRWNRRAL